MTGHGQSHQRSETHSIDCEIRSVNNRYLKLNISWPEQYARLETAVQKIIRNYARRGTFYLSFRIHHQDGAAVYDLNLRQFEHYRSAIRQHDAQVGERLDPSILLTLPGVVDETPVLDDVAELVWPPLKEAVEQAMVQLVEMRRQEGNSMARDLLENLENIEENLAGIEDRAPLVVAEYSQRLTDRINQLLEGLESSVETTDIVREIGIFAERADISEEIVRLKSHLDQFRKNVQSSRADGRKLEFVTQEMLRETNTIGSKASDADIAHRVVEIKTAIERIREMVQNIE